MGSYIIKELKTPTSSSKVSILNGSMVKPWVPPISPLMEEFEVKAISSAPNHSLWLRYVDDTFGIQWAEHSHQFGMDVSHSV